MYRGNEPIYHNGTLQCRLACARCGTNERTIATPTGKTIQSFIDMLWGEEEAEPFPYMYRHIPDLLLGLDYLLKADVRDKLSCIRVPLLLIHGERDRICPPQAAQYIYERTNDCTFMLMPNVGHAPHVTQPNACAHYIQTWLGGGRND